MTRKEFKEKFLETFAANLPEKSKKSTLLVLKTDFYGICLRQN